MKWLILLVVVAGVLKFTVIINQSVMWSVINCWRHNTLPEKEVHKYHWQQWLTLPW